MKRCLAIAGVFPPYGGAGAVRQVKLFNHLRAHGWQVDVIAPRGRAGWHRDPELAAEAAPLRVVRTGLPGAPATLEHLRAAAKDPSRTTGRSGLQRFVRWARRLRDLAAFPDEMVMWAGPAWAQARRMLARVHYDAVLTSSPPYSVHLVGLGLRRGDRPRWVAEHRDPWVGHRFRLQGESWRRAADQKLEAAVIAAADATIAISPAMGEELRGRYGLGDELHVITNGFDPSDFAAPKKASREPFELVYVGTFDHRLTPPDPLLDALALVFDADPNARERMRFRFLGGADLEASAQLRRWAEDNDAGDVLEMEGFQGHQSATRAMGAADALALSLAPGADWVLTSKVFEYLGSGRPIVAAVPRGDCRALLERCGGAVVVEPTDAATLAVHLLRLLDGNSTEVAARRPEVIQEYEYRHIAARVAAVLEGAAAP